MSFWSKRLAGVWLVGLLSAAWAQDTSVITGRVYDNAGSVIPGAAISLLNTGTNYKLELPTNADGLYVSPPLPAGSYRLTVAHPGFRPSAKALLLSISERPAVDFVLELGAVNESITVEALPPVLQTEVTTLSTLRSEREVKSIPINGRNFAELVRFTAGVVPAQAMKLNLALSQQRGNTTNSVNGSSLGDNNFLVDGLQNNNNHQGWGLINYP
ncbi:MAG: carboxypeptidase-like regulatory domain-containing protein, partial [Bryobacteraceae bacterium]